MAKLLPKLKSQLERKYHVCLVDLVEVTGDEWKIILQEFPLSPDKTYSKLQTIVLAKYITNPENRVSPSQNDPLIRKTLWAHFEGLLQNLNLATDEILNAITDPSEWVSYLIEMGLHKLQAISIAQQIRRMEEGKSQRESVWSDFQIKLDSAEITVDDLSQIDETELVEMLEDSFQLTSAQVEYILPKIYTHIHSSGISITIHEL